MKTEFKVPARGFTSIELIVVIAVIVVFVGMIMPAGRGTYGKSNRIKCVNNLSQIGLAFRVFAGDHNDLMPWQVTNSPSYRGETRAWIHFQAVSNELNTAKMLACPDDKPRFQCSVENFKSVKESDPKSLSVLQNDAVSFFVGINAHSSKPQGILAGDRNVGPSPLEAAYSTKAEGRAVAVAIQSEWSVFPANKVHDNQGNLLLGDGSVQQASISGLQNQMKLSTNVYGTNFNRFVFPQ